MNWMTSLKYFLIARVKMNGLNENASSSIFVFRAMSPSSGSNKASPPSVEARRIVSYLLQEGELLGDVLHADLLLAERGLLFILQANAGHHGGVAEQGQGSRDGEGLFFRPGGRGLHHPWDPPLKTSTEHRDGLQHILNF